RRGGPRRPFIADGTVRLPARMAPTTYLRMRSSSNPTYGRHAIARLAAANVNDGTMLTLPGIAGKASVLLPPVVASAAYPWRTAALHGSQSVMTAAAIGCIGGLVIGLFTIFSPS